MRKIIAILCSLACLFAASPVSAASAGTPEEHIFLTTVMYHSVLNSKRGVYIVSEAQLECDITALKKLGYEFVFPSEVIAYAEGKGNLPEKPLMITFDDGHYNNLYYGLPILLKHGAKACINVIGKFTEHSTVSGDDSNPNYSHLTWEQLGILKESGVFEIGSHTYNMHNYKPRFGVAPIYGESETEYRAALKKDVSQINEKLIAATGEAPDFFAYPFGKYNDTVKEELIDAGIKLMMTCNEGVTKISRGKPESIHYIKRFNRSGLYSVYEFTQNLAASLKKAQNVKCS